jgi:hypothetical protein
MLEGATDGAREGRENLLLSSRLRREVSSLHQRPEIKRSQLSKTYNNIGYCNSSRDTDTSNLVLTIQRKYITLPSG